MGGSPEHLLKFRYCIINSTVNSSEESANQFSKALRSLAATKSKLPKSDILFKRFSGDPTRCYMLDDTGFSVAVHENDDVYCNRQHSALKCNVVTKPDVRCSILRRKGKCFSCLKSGHLAKNCP